MESSKPWVLLADDDPTALRIVSQCLQAAGYQVRTAANGAEAWSIIEADCPDYLITDWEMPRLNGLELCRRVRQEALPHYLYIVLLTGKSGTKELVAGLEAGADDFLTKPVGREELVARLQAGGRVLALEQRLSEMARTDPLTGVPTRRAFHEQFERELNRAQRFHLPLSCVILDVDYFKQVNDTYGHAAGDAVLKSVAMLLETSCRASDYVCRYGGEEFCILLTETTESAACIWAERARVALAALRVPFEGSVLQITASFGVAQRSDDTTSPSQLINLADQALMVAKQAGRDRVLRFRALDDTHALYLTDTSDPFANLLARNVMTTLVACLEQDEPIGKAAEFFLCYRINSSPVVDEHGKLAGILSEKDVIGVMTSPGSWNRPIREVMKTNVVCYDEDASVRTIYDFLCRVTIRRVVIVKDGYPVGLISRGTLLRWFSNWLAMHSQRMAHSLEPDGDRSRRKAAIVKTARALSAAALGIERQIADDSEDFLPVLVDGASRMQELITDLLADSRHFLEPGGIAHPVSEGYRNSRSNARLGGLGGGAAATHTALEQFMSSAAEER